MLTQYRYLLTITITTPDLLPITPKPTIHFLNFVLITFWFSIIIIIVHKKVKTHSWYKQLLQRLIIIFLTYILSWITMIYMLYIINKSHPNIKYQYHTIFSSILQYNISLHHDIYCDSGLPYYIRLFMLTNLNFILFSLKYNILFLSYNHLHI